LIAIFRLQVAYNFLRIQWHDYANSMRCTHPRSYLESLQWLPCYKFCTESTYDAKATQAASLKVGCQNYVIRMSHLT